MRTSKRLPLGEAGCGAKRSRLMRVLKHHRYRSAVCNCSPTLIRPRYARPPSPKGRLWCIPFSLHFTQNLMRLRFGWKPWARSRFLGGFVAFFAGLWYDRRHDTKPERRRAHAARNISDRKSHRAGPDGGRDRLGIPLHCGLARRGHHRNGDGLVARAGLP